MSQINHREDPPHHQNDLQPTPFHTSDPNHLEVKMTSQEIPKPLSEKVFGYFIAFLGGTLGGPIGLVASPVVLLILNSALKQKDDKQPNRFLIWSLIGIVGAPLSLAPFYTGTNSSATKANTSTAEKVADWSWVPMGFQADLTSGTLAFKQLENTRTNCRLNIPCIQFEVLSKDGCKTLYAVASLIDSNGTNVGYANDLTKNVMANQKTILTFSNTTSTAVDIGRPTFKCY